jgi:hypothetical protein
MRMRLLAATAAAIVTVIGSIPVAQADPSAAMLQRLTVAQTQLLFRYYHGQPQVASPPSCRGSASEESEDVFLLPTLSFGSGNARFHCRTDRAVLVQMNGFAVSEDARTDTWTLADGEVLRFTRANLQRICHDVVRILTPAPATLDGHPVRGTQVITRNFTVRVNRDADSPGSPFYTDSVQVGHPGRLTACVVAYTALLRLSPGHHLLRVDLSKYTAAPTVFTYDLDVE